MGDLIRLVSIDASAAVVLLREQLYGSDDVLYHDLFYETDDEIADVALREKFRRFPCPWWRVQIVGRIGDEIVETSDLVSVTKPTPRDARGHMAAIFAEPGRLSDLLHAIADHVEGGTSGEVSARPTRQRQRETVMEREYLSLRDLATYIGRSKRWLEDRIKDSDHPLPVYRFSSGKLSVKMSEFQRWASEYRQVGDPDVKKIVSDVMSSLRKPR